jgi:hypothetical protein
MADLRVDSTPAGLSAGFRVWSGHPTATAAAVEAVTAAVCQPGDVLTCWAVHKDEQDGLRDTAYEHERMELGSRSIVHIEELPRPRERGVVWIDRYHLLATGAAPAVMHRLCGLYLTAEGGEIVCCAHDPSVAELVTRHVWSLPHTDARTAWDDDSIMLSCRVSVRSGSAAGAVDVRLPPVLAAPAHAAIDATRQRVAHL